MNNLRTQADGDEGRSAPAIPPIGRHLETARRSQRRTITDVARASGLTKGFLSKLERDKATASVASLMRLCEVLEISVASLFEVSTGDLVRKDDYPRINFGGEQLTESLLTPHGEQRLQAILSEIEPGGGSGAELYSLPVEIEFAFVLAGRLAVQLEHQEILLEAGDALTFAAHSRHGFRNPDAATPTRVLWVYAPSLPVAAGPAADGARKQSRASRASERAEGEAQRNRARARSKPTAPASRPATRSRPERA